MGLEQNKNDSEKIQPKIGDEIQVNTSGITPEIVQGDIERTMSLFGSMGEGTAVDRAAQMVLQTIQVSSRRLDKPEVLKLLYTQNPDAARILPTIVSKTIDKVISGEISAEEGRSILLAAVPQYMEVFQTMGITPERSAVLWIPPKKP